MRRLSNRSVRTSTPTPSWKRGTISLCTTWRMAPWASTGAAGSRVRLVRMDCISKGSLNRCGWVKRMQAFSSTSSRSAVTYL